MFIKPPFYATQIVNPFINSIILANHEKGEELMPMAKSLYPRIVFLVYNLFYLNYVL